MKKFIIIILVLLPVMAFGQSKWDGFFKPLPHTMFTGKAVTKEFKFRPAVELSAVQLTYDKVLKQLNASSFTSAGLGVSYQLIEDNGGIPYAVFGINALFLLDMIPAETTSAGMGAAITISALRYISIGVGYNFTNKYLFFPIGITINFN